MSDETAAMPERESMEFDVVIVGAGPAGLAAAIRLKQVAPELSVVVLEKGAQVGAHVLSGAVVDPIGIDALLPDWRQEEGTPFRTPVSEDRFMILGKESGFTLPAWLMKLMPPLMHNDGNFIVSLGEVCAWLAAKAEALGVEIYCGFAAADLSYDESGAVEGVILGDMGVHKDGSHGPDYTPGMKLLGKYVLLAEGARGSLSKRAIHRFGLDAGRDVPKFGIGIKELWEVAPERHRPGLVQHSFGWPLDGRTGGGSFLYHLDNNLVAVGFVVHLNYANPYLSPFEEFQRFKTHRAIKPVFEGGRRIAYGARAITEGGWQSVPKLVFPGGALVGCAAGFVNVPRIKGSHNAVLSGIEAASAVAAAIGAGRSRDTLDAYEAGWRQGPIGQDLRLVRNVKPLWSRFGTYAGIAMAGADMWLTTLFGGWSPFGTLRHGKPDHVSLEPAARHEPIAYPTPDGVVSFDRLSSVYLSNTNHAEDQPVHLKLADAALQKQSELAEFAGPSTRYCPAGVYEWMGTGDEARFVINAQNCVHCKTCDIKDPNQNIDWQPPQGGEGPVYVNM
ncbi:Electron transfer flavoprotein-ubiquinone oxidored uctase [Devosia sp. DBB001]|nr:Electron transfer flavoprotein-ubiquinone oxidored uctase [Devosia sp. DBB001]